MQRSASRRLTWLAVPVALVVGIYIVWTVGSGQETGDDRGVREAY